MRRKNNKVEHYLVCLSNQISVVTADIFHVSICDVMQNNLLL